MRILIYTHSFAPNVGGQETIVMYLAQGLVQTRISALLGTVELTVVTPIPANGMNDAALPFRVVRHPSLAALFHLLHRADVIHLAGPVFIPMILAVLMRKPVIIEHHGFQAICPNGQLLFEPKQEPCPGHFMAGRYRECIRCNSGHGKLRSLKMLLLTFPRRWLCQRASANILPTEWLGGLLRLSRMKTIVHGLPALGAASAERVGPSTPTFAFLGRLVGTKGVRVLLQAAQHLKTRGLAFRVKIIGEGPDREALEKLTLDLHVHDCVQFLGYIPTEHLQECLADATAVIMPSLAGEVFGLVAAENMQHERLVIVSDIGALSEVVGDAGMKFVPGDAECLADRMETVVANPSIAHQLGYEASQRIADAFSQELMALQHLELYKELQK